MSCCVVDSVSIGVFVDPEASSADDGSFDDMGVSRDEPVVVDLCARVSYCVNGGVGVVCNIGSDVVYGDRASPPDVDDVSPFGSRVVSDVSIIDVDTTPPGSMWESGGVAKFIDHSFVGPRLDP